MFCNILIIKLLRYVHRTSIFVHLLTSTIVHKKRTPQYKTEKQPRIRLFGKNIAKIRTFTRSIQLY
jgi:hypothetical protein